MNTYRKTLQRHRAFNRALELANDATSALNTRLKSGRYAEDVAVAVEHAKLLRLVGESFLSKADIADLMVQGIDITDTEVN